MNTHYCIMNELEVVQHLNYNEALYTYTCVFHITLITAVGREIFRSLLKITFGDKIQMYRLL